MPAADVKQVLCLSQLLLRPLNTNPALLRSACKPLGAAKYGNQTAEHFGTAVEEFHPDEPVMKASKAGSKTWVCSCYSR